jgi:hypothetical protein
MQILSQPNASGRGNHAPTVNLILDSGWAFRLGVETTPLRLIRFWISVGRGNHAPTVNSILNNLGLYQLPDPSCRGQVS